MCLEKTDIVVLGYKLRTDGSIDPVLKLRLDFAVTLADSLGDCFGKYILSGGQWMLKGYSDGPTEAEVMWEYLHKQHKISLSRVRSETQSRTTVENARNLFTARDELQLGEFIVVTSWSHRRRARKIFSSIFGKLIVVRSSSFAWNEWLTLVLAPAAWAKTFLEIWRTRVV